MSFTESIKTCFQKYIDFSGRASRSEYWWFFLFTLIVRVLIGWIPGVGFILTLVLLLPTLAVTVRRLHDTNRTGWWLLLPIGLTVAAVVFGVVLSFQGMILIGVGVAVIGSLLGFVALLAFLVQPGDDHDNPYGPDPLQPAQGVGGFGYAEPGHPYPPPPTDGFGATGGVASETPPQAFSAPASDLGPDPDPDPDPSQRRYCAQCGTQLQPDTRFCTHCGTGV